MRRGGTSIGAPILNHFNYSGLPRLWDIAEAIREGTTTCDEVAAVYKIRSSTLRQRLNRGGWNSDGTPQSTAPATTPPCARCGRQRIGHRISDLCQDCLNVEPTWPQFGGAA